MIHKQKVGGRCSEFFEVQSHALLVKKGLSMRNDSVGSLKRLRHIGPRNPALAEACQAPPKQATKNRQIDTYKNGQPFEVA